MGKKQKTNEKNNRKMSSIAGKLHGQLVLAKLGAFFAADIFLSLVLFVFWMVNAELSADIDHFDWRIRRYFHFANFGLGSFEYVVRRGETVFLEKNAGFLLLFVITVVSTALFFQFFSIAVPYYSEYKKIKKTLTPINEMALRAEEISRISFDESKFHTIENAIENISPEQTGVKLGDTDLQGIETAINNMLHRMHDTYMQQARFVNDASHELRTPISVIQGYADMLDRWGKEDPAVLEESITAIKTETEHMNHLVEQLLFLARGDAGRNEVKKERICLNAILKQIYDESMMIDKNHTYRFEEKAEDVCITGDEALIKQAVRILVDNAAKYTKAGDEIALSVGMKTVTAENNYSNAYTAGKNRGYRNMTGRYYSNSSAAGRNPGNRNATGRYYGNTTTAGIYSGNRNATGRYYGNSTAAGIYSGNSDPVVSHPYIQVQDTGAGMADVDVSHMFERFYRADDTRQVQGTGLGLSIAKWIMDMHNGYFEVTSRKEIGTRICMIFK